MGFIVGIGGRNGAGKDTAASMLNYIGNVGITKASYHRYLIDKVKHDGSLHRRALGFADNLKKCLSIMYSLPLVDFYDRKKKDELWYCIDQHRYLTEKEVVSLKYTKVTIKQLEIFDLEDIVVTPERPIVLKLRTLIQYFGTIVVRKRVGSKIWINSTLRTAGEMAANKNFVIISDVRLPNESEAIQRHSLYGGVIKIERGEVDTESFVTEQNTFSYSHVIDNNSTLMNLFYNLVSTLQDISNKYRCRT